MGLISDRGPVYGAGESARRGNGRHAGHGSERADDLAGRRAGYDERADGAWGQHADSAAGRDDGVGYGPPPTDPGRGQRAGYDRGRAAGPGRGQRAGYGEGYDSGRRGHVRRRVASRRGRYGRGGIRSVPVVAAIAVAASIAVVAAAIGANGMFTARNAAANAPAVNMNCTLIVPANPLTAQGLATPYQLTATDPANGPCNEANPNQTAFVQGAVIDPATGQISVYDPLVVDAGTQPAAMPVVPTLPAGAVAAVWFGFNGGTLSLAGPDQAPPAQGSSSATPAQATTSAAASPSAPSSSGASQPVTGSQSPSASPAEPTDTGTSAASSVPTDSASPGTPSDQLPADQGTPASSDPATATVPATATAPDTAAAAAAGAGPTAGSKAAVLAEGSAPLAPDSSADAQYNATLTQLGQAGGTGPSGSGSTSPAGSASPAGSSPSSAPGSAAAAASSAAASSPSAAPSGSAAAPSMSAAATMSAPPANTGGDGPAASAAPDATLQQANCVAGDVIGGQFSAFTQVGACNAIAFFSAANAAIGAGKLTVPSPGTAADGKKCLTTRSFALIDQDQSDNVTTEYLAAGNGQIAQDTAANRQALAGSTTLFNGSDNGLLDLFVDPALGCMPWQVPNLADGGAPAPALPLDELQAARYAAGRGNPAALVPLNDPMTLDNNGQFSTNKTNAYRALVDMPPLPAGESPHGYCSDMERIQGSRLQQDVNLLTRNPGPMPAAANSLFTFLAMRLQQSFTNLNCGNFGLQNDVSTTVDGNGVVVAACFLNQVAPITAGPGNPTAGMTMCPATMTSDPGATSTAGSAGAAPSSTASASASPSAYQRHHSRHHHWW